MKVRCGPEEIDRTGLFCNERRSLTCKSRQTSRFAIISTGRYPFSAVNSNLNLASKPFSNRLLPWALTAIILFISVIGLLVVIRLTTVAKSEGDTAQVEINKLRQQEQELMKAADEIKGMLSADQQQAVPAAHQLVDRRKFLWSRF